MKKDEWLEKFGACIAIENTSDEFVRLLREENPWVGPPTFLWSEFDRICGLHSSFPGTRWAEIVSGVHPLASRFYRREKPYFGFWALVSGDVVGPRNAGTLRLRLGR
jgi:hypothetical protein